MPPLKFAELEKLKGSRAHWQKSFVHRIDEENDKFNVNATEARELSQPTIDRIYSKSPCVCVAAGGGSGRF